MMDDDLSRIIDVDGDELLVRAFDMPDRPQCAVGLRVECASPFGIGVGLDIDGLIALRAALDKAESAYWKRTAKPMTGIIDAACEPSTRDRIFYKPQSITLPNGEVRHFSPPDPPFEPCPVADDRGLGGKVVKATHPEPIQGKMSAPSEIKALPRDVQGLVAEMEQIAKMSKTGAVELPPDIPLPPLEWPMGEAKTTIYGHERETLRWALRDIDRPPHGGIAGATKDTWRARDAARDDLCDPAKLAVIIVDLMTAHGIESQALTLKNGHCCFAFVDPCDCDVVRRVFTMPQARAFALALLEAPNATTLDFERRIKEVSP